MAKVTALHREQPRRRGFFTIIVILLVLVFISALGLLLLDFIGIVPISSLLDAVPWSNSVKEDDNVDTDQVTARLEAEKAVLVQQRNKLADDLAAKETELATLQSEVERLQQELQIEAGKSAAKESVAAIYANMPAKDAARILSELDDDEVVPILSRLKKEQAAAILAAMESGRAAKLTLALSN
ncbi:MAG: MotE family protein [bacterium]|jgi:flagellar motility protein MotE (MotC chaperone)